MNVKQGKTLLLNIIIFIGFLLCSCDKNPLSPGDVVDEWVVLNSGLGSLYVQDIAIDPQFTNIVYAATFGGIYKSTDGGEHWCQCSVDITSEDIKCVAVSPHDSNILFCGTWGQGIFKSIDAGTSWQLQNAGIPNPRINELEFDQVNPEAIYAACADRLFMSPDLGVTWTQLFDYGNVRSVAIHPLQSEVLLIGVEFHGIFKSENGGQDWQLASS